MPAAQPSPNPAPASRRTWHEVVWFGFIGVGATALHYGLYWLLMDTLRPAWAYSTGYAVSLCANFALNAAITFGARASVRRGVGFLAAHGVNYLLHIGLLALFLHVGVPKAWAPLPVFAIAVPVNFLLVRRVFRGRA